MSSPIVPNKLPETVITATDTTTGTTTEQVSSILNNNYIKIGAAVFVVFIIFVIILYYSFRTPEKVVGTKATEITDENDKENDMNMISYKISNEKIKF